MRTFSIPTATLGLTLTTACGTPTLDWQDTLREQQSDDRESDTSTPTSSEQGIEGMWLGSHIEIYTYSVDLPYSETYEDGSTYSFTLNLALNADLDGQLMYEGEQTDPSGSSFTYAGSFACTGMPAGSNSYAIEIQDVELSLQCVLDGDALECASVFEGMDFSIDFTRG